MTCTIIIPLKANSERLPKKNFRMLQGTSLWKIALRKAMTLKADGYVNEVAVFGERMLKAGVPDGVTFIEEPRDVKRTCSNEMFKEAVSQVSRATIAMFNSICPFVTLNSLIECIEAVTKLGYDSACTVRQLSSRIWTETGVPIMHNPERCPLTQTETQNVVEVDCMWVFHRSIIMDHHRRVGFQPKFVRLNSIEAIQVKTKYDWDIVKTLGEGL